MAYGHIKRKLISSITAIALLIVAAAAQAEVVVDLEAEVVSVEGEVFIVHEGRDDRKQITAGARAPAGSTIQTAPGASCALEWGFGNAMRLGPSSELKISKLQYRAETGGEVTSLYLLGGRVHANSDQADNIFSRFQVRTPSSLAESNRAVFAVEILDNGAARVSAYEGPVHVSGRAGGKITLHSMESTMIKNDHYPDEKTVLDSLAAERNVPDEIKAAGLRIFSPLGDMTVDSPYLNIEGAAAPGSVVTVNRTRADTGSDGGFHHVMELSPGSNDIVIAATGGSGASEKRTRTITYRPPDNEFPAGTAAAALLHVDSPRDNFTTSKTEIEVSGYTVDGSDVSINGVDVAMKPGSRRFDTSVGLEPGENDLTVTAGYAGKTRTEKIKVYREPAGPELTVFSPAGVFDDRSGECGLAGTILYCTVTGRTEPGAVLTINNQRIDVRDDGSFSHTVPMAHTETRILVIARSADGAESIRILSRNIDRERVAYIDVYVSPQSIVADNVSSANVSVRILNLLGNPVEGARIKLDNTSGGYLDATTLTSGADGTVSTTFNAGIGSTVKPVTITATSMDITGTAILTLLPDAPPLFDE